MGTYKIVLTGGPGGGKTTILNNITKRLQFLGYQVFIVPETARIFIENGVKPNPEDYNYTMQYQDAILKEQLLREKTTEYFAQLYEKYNSNKTIILYDRATIDNRAYLPTQDDFEFILKNNNVSELELIDKYDLVIDLVSLAVTSKNGYVNDKARTESPEMAKELDKKTTEAWLLHPNLKIILPTDNLFEKEEIVMAHILGLLEDRKDLDNIAKKVTSYQQQKLLEKLKDRETKTIEITTYGLATHSFKSREYWLTRRIHKHQFSYILEMFFEEGKSQYCYERKILTEQEFNELLEKYYVYETKKRTETIFVKKFEINKFCTEKNDIQLIVQPNQGLVDLEKAESKKFVKHHNLW